ncbi:MAG: DUF3179 domain-containing (seleno)protein [Planctomycetota bacterium]|nr:DUF3179 domain-containing (seleno)protein [Planctomycetota bacterium]
MNAPHPLGFPTLTLRGGGWILLAFVAITCGFLAWAMSGVFTGDRPTGSGNDPAAYGFTLDPLHADRGVLVGSGSPRDFLPSLDAPAVMRGADMLRWNEEHRTRYVVSNDRVAGVVVNGEARAYPLDVLNAHEVINDTLGGVPIAVSYSPLTDSLVVFDRRIDGAERTFHVSGLLYNSNLVMYDRTAGTDGSATPSASTAGASLWSQLGMRAIAGPAAAHDAQLIPLPDANITSWRMWTAVWPDTTVIMGDPAQANRYKEFSYARYYLSPRVDYPVSGLVAALREPTSAAIAMAEAAKGDPRSRKTAVIEVRQGDARAVYSLAELATRADKSGRVAIDVGGRNFEATVQPSPLAAIVRATDGKPALVIPQLWFAHEAKW